MTWVYTQAEDGNVALTGEIELQAAEGCFVLALGFGGNAAEAGHRALASLQDGFATALADYEREWQAWQRSLLFLDKPAPGERDLYRISAAVLRTHEAKDFSGGLIASRSIPWGLPKGMRTWAATTWSGRGIWWRRLEGCSLQGRRGMPAVCRATCRPPQRTMDTGPRICGSTARHIGTACRWTRPPCRSCW